MLFYGIICSCLKLDLDSSTQDKLYRTTRIHDKHGDVLTDSTGYGSSSPLTHLLGYGFCPDLVGAQKLDTHLFRWVFFILIQVKPRLAQEWHSWPHPHKSTKQPHLGQLQSYKYLVMADSSYQIPDQSFRQPK